MRPTAIIVIARLILGVVVLAIVALSATIRMGFATSPAYFSDGRILAAHAVVFCLLAFIGWLALAGPYHWARLNRGEEGVGRVWATEAKAPGSFALVRTIGPYLVAAILTLGLYQWVTAPLLHRLVGPEVFSETFQLTAPASYRKGCSPLQLRDGHGVDHTFCLSESPQVPVGSQVFVQGTRSWFGIFGESFSVQSTGTK